ncbi:hypothetical protein AB0M23_23445 [Streptomyces sp. NPDC052077]|uniref:hypothetical protein n=1 Tax=Streptomyces sp. NPDC052077 TaxID=3154757 RepID=UPI003420355B
MSWTRRAVAALAVCLLPLAGVTGCGTGGTREPGAGRTSAAPVGRLLDSADEEGNRYREVDAAGAPGAGLQVQPSADGGWEVGLDLRGFRLSPSGAPDRAVAGRGFARLFLDGEPLVRLRGPRHRLDAALVPRGTHRLTVRLYADDGTVWAVDGRPVESTADLTVSDTGGGPAGEAGERGTEGTW